MAVIIYSQKLNEGDINALASEYLDEEKGVKTVEEAIQEQWTLSLRLFPIMLNTEELSGAYF